MNKYDPLETRLANLKYMVSTFNDARGEGGQQRYADKVDVSAGYISQMLTKRRPFTEKSAIKHAGKLGLDSGWFSVPHPELWGGDIDLSVSETSTPKSNAEIIGGVDGWDDSTPLDSDDVELPYYSDVLLAAGNGHQTEEFPTDKKLRFSKITLKKAGVDINNALCVKTNGSSMEPMLPDGSVVGVDTSRTNIIDGKVYAIRHNDELRIKQLYKAPGGGIRLRSYNQSEFPDEHYSAEDAANISVIGYVFWYSALI